MNLDQHGLLWLSNPWIAASLTVVAVGIVVWCHRLLMDGSPTGAVGVRSQAERRLRQHYTHGSSAGLGLSCQLASGRERRHGRPRRAA
jgi:hypothetical protein